MAFQLNVNGRLLEVRVSAGTRLLTVLRDDLGLTATRFGCGQGDCGACYVLADGRPVPSCTLTIEEVEGKAIVTVEGLSSGDEPSRVQAAFIEEDAMQCGYCTSGMLVSATALLARTKAPDEAEIRRALEPHLCRCGVYGRVIRAVQRASR